MQWPVFITVFLNVLYKTLMLKCEKNKCLFVAVLGGQTRDLAHELSTLPKCACMIYVCSMSVRVGVKSYVPVSVSAAVCAIVRMCRSEDNLGCWSSTSTLVEIVVSCCWLPCPPGWRAYKLLEILLPPPPIWQAGITDVCSCIQLYMGDGDLNSHSHVCIANTLSTEPSPQPKVAAPPSFCQE